MQWKMLVEVSNEFVETGEVFQGSMEDVNQHIVDLNSEDGRCYAAQAIIEE